MKMRTDLGASMVAVFSFAVIAGFSGTMATVAYSSAIESRRNRSMEIERPQIERQLRSRAQEAAAELSGSAEKDFPDRLGYRNNACNWYRQTRWTRTCESYTLVIRPDGAIIQPDCYCTSTLLLEGSEPSTRQSGTVFEVRDISGQSFVASSASFSAVHNGVRREDYAAVALIQEQAAFQLQHEDELLTRAQYFGGLLVSALLGTFAAYWSWKRVRPEVIESQTNRI
ncbi:MAG: hypothetical protein H7A21_13345 [Spirochaetales bacterium]|nr:hypothetical protein [Leptospiraceae bacterium]MCP5482414.1 hypothetical protein [Spirochaetales bacterium]MCP5485882.1 hypothetical protein [Spirochaetales bacterium]